MPGFLACFHKPHAVCHLSLGAAPHRVGGSGAIHPSPNQTSHIKELVSDSLGAG